MTKGRQYWASATMGVCLVGDVVESEGVLGLISLSKLPAQSHADVAYKLRVVDVARLVRTIAGIHR